MASWPTQSDYKDALQNPDTAFRDPDLQRSQAERSPMGVPRARSGAFASVYKMTGPKGVMALKLFNFPNEDRAQRYKAVSDYLELELGPRKPPCVVKFQYHLEGIRVGKGWYPTLTMAWVKGVSLGEWVRQTVERKVPDLAAVRKMSESWAALVKQLQDARIAHGDLQHDNVMVVGDAPVLVDYDGMCVPALDPSDPNKKLEQLEFGKPAYQHPARPAERLGGNLDHFSAWVILVALRAIAADPSLYVRHVLKTDNENLLFSPHDMQNPASSTLWPDLLRCGDADVRDWSRALREALDRPFDRIPAFTLDPFDRLRKLAAASPRDWVAIEAEADRLRKAGKDVPPELRDKVNPVSGLKELCDAPRKDWPTIVSEGERLIATGKTLPPDLRRTLEEARRRVACRDAVRKALDARDPRAARAAYQPALIDDWADRSLVAAARGVDAQVALLERLRAAVAAPGDGKALVKLWDEAAPTVSGVAEAAGYQKAAEAWRRRIVAAADFVRAFGKSPQTERELAEAWQAVAAAGPPHPSLTDAHRVRGESALRWSPLLEKLRLVPRIDSYENDTRLLGVWGTGSALAGCREATEFAPRVGEARARVALVDALEKAIRAADAGGPEEAVVAAAVKLPAGYAHPHATRAEQGSEAVRLMADMQKAIDAPHPSDRKIAAAYDRLKARNPKLAKRLDRVNPKLHGEAERATVRRKALDAFARIDADEPRADTQDERWLALWGKHKDLLGERRDREELRARLTLAHDRHTKWAKLAQALDARNMFALRKLFAAYSGVLAGYPPLVDRMGEIQTLLAKAGRVIEIQEKLSTGGVLGGDDLKFLRDNHEAFGPAAKAAIEKQVRARLSGDARLVPGYPAYAQVGRGLVKACWAWGGHGLISHCVVVVDGRRFLASPEEADPYSRLNCRAENHQRDGGGMLLSAPPGATQVYVTVWPVVELGWTVIHGPPIAVGPVPVNGRLK